MTAQRFLQRGTPQAMPRPMLAFDNSSADAFPPPRLGRQAGAACRGAWGQPRVQVHRTLPWGLWLGNRLEKLCPEVAHQFLNYYWPGNVRELYNRMIARHGLRRPAAYGGKEDDTEE